MSGLLNIQPHTAKTFEDLRSGFRFRVLGDGQVEREIVERFERGSILVGIEDEKIQNLAKLQHTLDRQRLDQEKTQRELAGQLETVLGKQWKVSSYGTRGGQGLSYFHAEHSQPGAGLQTLYFDNRDQTLSLDTQVHENGWKIEHSIKTSHNESGRIDLQGWSEAAYFNREDSQVDVSNI